MSLWSVWRFLLIAIGPTDASAFYKYSDRYELYLTSGNRAPLNVDLEETVTSNAEVSENHENPVVVSFFLSVVFELRRLQKLACLSHNTDKALDAGRTASFFCK